MSKITRKCIVLTDMKGHFLLLWLMYSTSTHLAKPPVPEGLADPKVSPPAELPKVGAEPNVAPLPNAGCPPNAAPDPNLGAPPNAGLPPNAGGLPNPPPPRKREKPNSIIDR